LIEPEYNKIYLTTESFDESRKIIKRCKLSENHKKLIHDVYKQNMKHEVPILFLMDNCTC